MRINFPYLFTIISLLPNVTFMFIGNIDYYYQPGNTALLKRNIRILKKFPNVLLLHSRTRTELIPYLQKAKAAIIPFDTDQKRVEYSFPMKTMEYLYFGLPILSTPIKELKRYTPYIAITNNGKRAVRLLQQFIHEPHDPKKFSLRRQIALDNTWKSKIHVIRTILMQTSAIRL